MILVYLRIGLFSSSTIPLLDNRLMLLTSLQTVLITIIVYFGVGLLERITSVHISFFHCDITIRTLEWYKNRAVFFRKRKNESSKKVSRSSNQPVVHYQILSSLTAFALFLIYCPGIFQQLFIWRLSF
jgi:hypothetical protein